MFGTRCSCTSRQCIYALKLHSTVACESPRRAHVACAPRLRQRQSFLRTLLSQAVKMAPLLLLRITKASRKWPAWCNDFFEHFCCVLCMLLPWQVSVCSLRFACCYCSGPLGVAPRPATTEAGACITTLGMLKLLGFCNCDSGARPVIACTHSALESLVL